MKSLVDEVVPKDSQKDVKDEDDHELKKTFTGFSQGSGVEKENLESTPEDVVVDDADLSKEDKHKSFFKEEF